MSLFPPTVAELESMAARLDAQRTQIQEAVNGCPQLDPITRSQWESYDTSFQFTFDEVGRLVEHGSVLTILQQSGIERELERHATDLNAWRDRLAHLCAHLDIPDVPPEPKSGLDVELLSTGDKLLIGGGLAVILLLAIRR